MKIFLSLILSCFLLFVNISKIGDTNAIATIFVTQVATQGLLKTSISLAGDEIKEYFTKGIKDKLSNYIANDLFEINTNEWDNKQKQDIKTISNLSADLSVDMMIGGAYGIIKSAKKLDRVDGEFVEHLNSNTINKLDNKINHIFNKPEHNLNGFLKTFNNDTKQAYNATLEAIEKDIANGKLSGNFTGGYKIKINGFEITVRGIIKNGKPEIGTMFIP